MLTPANLGFETPKHSKTPEPRGSFNLVRKVPQTHYTQTRFQAYHRAEERTRRLLKTPSNVEFDLANEVLRMFRTETPCEARRPYIISRFPDSNVSSDLAEKCSLINAYKHFDLLADSHPKRLKRHVSIRVRSLTPKSEKRPNKRQLIDYCLACNRMKCICKPLVKDHYLHTASRRLSKGRELMEAAKAKLDTVKSYFASQRKAR
jgi:hypothetical protein